ncbi:hypothetical protein A3K48_03390 [candidate division WOR-1 bacterium RIFOXYA12_FULL_52_29]|uniref:Uncharacterized protein n=1 Tax=candidate division WOR-1 bacterium RIFOXYC12_FULL_54_18 TaxID=1802584 RepID=A0A1F4T618_UNCSA|nr:MAG: hypothetical protein A3K44_03390 [candidate division WOR-1 bacterium RIFOXYA2_FULL_51_19]OGC17609.1 MAG: hypothetical protein A3K48_03390 [candidate division WOR-1 bacterium RIFOXYA12_FULL_52_29]OGC26466.1 MAG: hypothetical protein A3K32_03385 [candidate division WOR-1 bacterium RIFOXYB2_FULL_45_9]OGC28026.1 MAG: hypothetical protein A3K49_03390 [candidate division WOR-1 bacterium RIFOXYC12_FULL_54_18]OGC29688.1 MAG: hypothetical protein A2346_02945 [candidate division WOR-1 bacterium R
MIKKCRNARPHPRVSAKFYEPFEKINSELNNSLNERKKCADTILKLTAGQKAKVYHMFKISMEVVFTLSLIDQATG